MAKISARELISAGVHFGHRPSRWNPKMARYIWGKRNGIHIIDVRETIRGLVEAMSFLRAAGSAGGKFLFVGTKRQAKDAARREGARTGMPFVAERWLGGTLTNLKAVRTQVGRLNELERIESDGSLERYTKKEIAGFRREKRKVVRNLEGIRDMEELPTALVVVDPKREKIAVSEAYKLRIPIVAMLDTDCDPDQIDIPVPANSDAIRSVSLVMSYLGSAVIEGRLAGGFSVPQGAEAGVAPESAAAAAPA